MKILITGATGELGSKTIDFLSSKINKTAITGLIRSFEKTGNLTSGIKLIQGEYNDIESLNHATKGIDVLLLISTNATKNRFEQHRNVIDTAKKNGIKHIVYTSVLHASDQSSFEPAIDHFKTEEYLKQQRINYTVFRNTFYVEFIKILMGKALETGIWNYPASDAKVNFVSKKDIAEALANVLANVSGHVNQVYEIASEKSYSFSQIAEIASNITNKTISYVPIQLETMKAGMRKMGLPEEVVRISSSAAKAIENGEFEASEHKLEVLLNRKPIEFSDALSELLKK